MSSIPSIKRAELNLKQAEKGENSFVIGCVACKQPLWNVTIEGQYGTKIKAKKEPFAGVPSYDEFWAKDQKTALRFDCPLCGEHYMKVLLGPDGIKIPKVWSPDTDY